MRDFKLMKLMKLKDLRRKFSKEARLLEEEKVLSKDLIFNEYIKLKNRIIMVNSMEALEDIKIDVNSENLSLVG